MTLTVPGVALVPSWGTAWPIGMARREMDMECGNGERMQCWPWPSMASEKWLVSAWDPAPKVWSLKISAKWFTFVNCFCISLAFCWDPWEDLNLVVQQMNQLFTEVLQNADRSGRAGLQGCLLWLQVGRVWKRITSVRNRKAKSGKSGTDLRSFQSHLIVRQRLCKPGSMVELQKFS